MVVSVMEKAWHDHVMYGFMETSASKSPLKHRKKEMMSKQGRVFALEEFKGNL
jgi:hypothetical protein